MAYPITCSTLIKNTGESSCSVNYGKDVKHILVPRGTEISTAANAILLATWTTGINAVSASRYRPIMTSWRSEFTQDEPVFQTGDYGAEDFLYVTSAKDVFYLQGSKITPKFNANMQSLSNGSWAVYTVTSNGYIKGKTVDGVKFLPIPCTFRMLPQRKNTDAEGAELAYTIRMDSTDDWNLYGAAVKPTDWNPKTSLTGLLDVNLAIVGTPSATEVVVSVLTDLNSDAVSTFAVGDFLFYKTSDDTAQTPESMTVVNGVYTFVFTSAVGGYVNLKAPSAASIKGYESTGSVTFTIS